VQLVDARTRTGTDGFVAVCTNLLREITGRDALSLRAAPEEHIDPWPGLEGT